MDISTNSQTQSDEPLTETHSTLPKQGDDPNTTPSADTPSATTPLNARNNTTFLLGPAAKRELRNLLKSTTDPATTITEFQNAHSLESCLVQGLYNAVSSSTVTIQQQQQQQEEEDPFHLPGVLSFLGHLGISRFDAHSAFRDALKVTLFEMIGTVKQGPMMMMMTARKKEALLKLLTSCWKWVHVPDIQPIVVQIIKSLGEDTPIPVLLELAKPNNNKGGGDFLSQNTFHPEDVSHGMKYSHVWEQLPLEMKQLIWEADWTHSILGDGTASQTSTETTVSSTRRGTLSDTTILLAQTLRPMVLEYVTDTKLQQDADLAFVPGIRDKKVATAARRTMSLVLESGSMALNSNPATIATTSSLVTKMHGINTSSLLKKTPATDTVGESIHKSSCAMAISKIKETLGTRPKLLGALFNMLMAEHGMHGLQDEGLCPGPSSDQYIVGGSSYLTCTLLSDLLISYSGQLPKQYETVCILADVLDTCVKDGVFTDSALAQVQACLRILYPQETTASRMTTSGSILSPNPSTKNIKISLSSIASSVTTTVDHKDDSTKDRTWIRKIIMDAIKRIKDCDPKNLFLQPVTDQIAPGYSSIIKKPICIRDMESKASMNQYTSLQDFEADVNLMFDNCIKYNIGKDGKWVREEARQQQVIWEEEIRKQVRVVYETERKKTNHVIKEITPVKSTANKTEDESRKRKHEVLLAQQELAKERTKGSGAMDSKKPSTGSIQPLVAFSGKRRKKDTDFPSMHALASMLLADPFVVRLLLDKVLRFIKSDVWNEKTIPASHSLLPSVVQILHIITVSTQLCQCKGKFFSIPSVGFDPNEEDVRHDHVDGVQHRSSYTLLRKSFPLLSKLWVEVEMDKRMSPGGDLFLVPASDRAIHMDASEHWSSQGEIICLLVQGIMIDILQPGSSNEALLTQMSRLNQVLLRSSWDPTNWRPFLTALISVVLKHKSKIPHTVRDFLASTWITWFHQGSMHSPIHEYFIKLLNEWSLLGNILLPRDKMLQFALEAAKTAEAKDDKSFSDWWKKNDSKNCRIKLQYERMLNSIPLDKAVEKWKKALNIESE